MPSHKFRSNSEYNTYCFLKENKVSFKYEKLTIKYEWLESKKYIPDRKTPLEIELLTSTLISLDLIFKLVISKL